MPVRLEFLGLLAEPSKEIREGSLAQAAIAVPRGDRAYLPHALAATLGVVVLPGALVYIALFVLNPDPPILVTSAASLILSVAASAVGSAFWLRTQASAEMSFGDLMMWQWYRRHRAAAVIDESATLLEPRAHAHSREDQLKALRKVNAALEAKDPYTLGHSRRVRLHAYRTGVAMRLSLHELEDLRLAAELHDVGKMMISDRIIRKPGPLDDAEWAAMKRHPSVGAQMVEGLNNQNVVQAIRSHHERYDGSGYPDGIAGEDIPLLARIISVADAFDAITSTRSYREKSDVDKARQILLRERGKQFDPAVVDAFLAQLPGRSPAAALTASIVPGLTSLLRQGAVAAKRAGVASLVGGIGAASASLAITASTFAPVDVPKPMMLGADQGVERSTAGKERAEERSQGHAFSGRSEDAPYGEQAADVAGTRTPRRDKAAARPANRRDGRGVPGRSDGRGKSESGRAADAAEKARSAGPATSSRASDKAADEKTTGKPAATGSAPSDPEPAQDKAPAEQSRGSAPEPSDDAARAGSNPSSNTTSGSTAARSEPSAKGRTKK